MKKIRKNNGSRCSGTECLKIEIFNHFSKVYTYIIWNGKHLLGEIAEDGISNLKLCKIIGVNYATSRKYIESPPQLKFIHAKRLADFIGLKIQDIVDTIVYDLN